eukprot:5448458-Pleurochrysis_carterae.AAC.1
MKSCAVKSHAVVKTHAGKIWTAVKMRTGAVMKKCAMKKCAAAKTHATKTRPRTALKSCIVCMQVDRQRM